MSPGADITSFAAINDFYAALAGFRTEAQNALAALAMSLQRASHWLSDQQHHWGRQIRVCEEEVSQAKAELRTRKFGNFSGERPDCTFQEENLRRAKARLQFAEDRLAAVGRWMKRLPSEIQDIFDGPARHLGSFLEADLQRGLAVLARQLTALEQYANLASPPASSPAPAREKS
jgi:hypothetical protein